MCPHPTSQEIQPARPEKKIWTDIDPNPTRLKEKKTKNKHWACIAMNPTDENWFVTLQALDDTDLHWIRSRDDTISWKINWVHKKTTKIL